MALTVTLLGSSFSVPESGDANYDAALTSYLKALATAFPQLSGGVQSLTAELDFGTSFGLKAAWYKSETVNPASAGQIRLAKTDSIKIRNNANGADLALAIDAGDALTFNGANVTGNPMLDATTAAGQTITSATQTTVVFGTVVTDTDAAYNSGTGVYTVPTGKGGPYQISCGAAFALALVATDVEISIYIAGVQKRYAQSVNPGAAQSLVISDTVQVNAGQTIECKVFQNAGSGKALTAIAAQNFFSLKRIPT